VHDLYFTYDGAGTGGLFDVRSWTFTRVGQGSTPGTTPVPAVPTVPSTPVTPRASTTTTVKVRGDRVAGRKVSLVVDVGSPVAPGGFVQVKDRGRGTRTVVVDGARTVLGMKLRGAGKHRLSVAYVGTATTSPSSDAVTVVARRPRR
jgi:hypothetical protein